MTDCQNNLMSDRLLKESNVIAALRGLLESPSMQELGTGISFLPEVAAAVHNVPETDVVPKDYHERCMELVTQRNIAQMRKRFEAEKQVPLWRSVKDELPEKPGHYLICTSINYWHGGCMDVNADDGTTEGYAGTVMSVLDCYIDITHDWNRVCNAHVTHWMPLPEPPKEGT